MITRLSLGQYVPVESIIHALDPRTKIMLVAVYMIAVFNARTYLQFGLLVISCILILVLSRVNYKIYAGGIKPFRFIILATILAQAIIMPGTPVISLPFIEVSRPGLTAGVLTGLRLVLILVMAQVLSTTTTPLALTGGMQKMLKPLGRVSFPVTETVMIMNTALRFIPLFVEEADRIRKAQMCRGAGLGPSSIKKRLLNIMALLIPLFVSAFKRANDLAQAMEARCYTGGERTSLYELGLTGRDYLVLTIILIWALLVIIPW
ncbi:MAG: energy-coupling factor transporter transmembrane component T family protein [Syntrophomonadaceae bacterium]|jgi:energy-coupling factor transport system permease protein